MMTTELYCAFKRQVLWLMLCGALGCLNSAAITSASAQAEFPTENVRLIVPLAAGGGVDLLGRVLAAELSEIWGQQVIVENKPGAGTQIGAQFVAEAAPDGHTILLTSNPHTVNPSLYESLPYDSKTDFAPVTQVASAPLLLVVHPSVEIESVPELVELAKAGAPKLSYGTSGIGGPQHMAGELFKSMAGVDMIHVPYRGSGPAMTELLGGHVQVAFASLLTALPHVETGQLRALAVTSEERSPVVPELPTVAEAADLDGYSMTTWYGILAPGATPEAIVAKLQADIARAINSPTVSGVLEQNGLTSVASTPQEFSTFLNEEMDAMEQLVRAADIRLE